MTSTQRSEALRARRAAAGQKRRELYLTDAEWVRVKQLVANLRMYAEVKKARGEA